MEFVPFFLSNPVALLEAIEQFPAFRCRISMFSSDAMGDGIVIVIREDEEDKRMKRKSKRKCLKLFRFMPKSLELFRLLLRSVFVKSGQNFVLKHP